MLQTVLITLHNISRWLVLVFGILAAARALVSAGVSLSAAEIAEKALHIAADICVFTNHNVNVMEL